ncbi:uncharacterized protein [Battus philenor]|uniref:uncharacterized protein n=1 Tax=Battus philenor TaxID=42288 RepID=UPI0035D0DCC9
MNELLQKHGCTNVFTIPEGLRELMSDISREVLREQPKNIFDFITNYLSVLLITREHGVMAVKILEELCDCRPSVSEHLLALGLEKATATTLAQIMKDEFESLDADIEKEKIKESDILKKVLASVKLEEDMAAKVCQVARNAYKDYVYRKKLMEQSTVMKADEPWQIAAERTLALYKKTKPSLDELHRATERIQAAYKGYHVRKNLLKHLKPKKKKGGPREELPGPPLDIAGSREIDLGPVINIKVNEDDVNAMFGEHDTVKLGLHYDPKYALTMMHNENCSCIECTDNARNLATGKTNYQNTTSYIRGRTDSTANPEILVVQMDTTRKESRDISQGRGIMRPGNIQREVPDDYDDQVSRDECKYADHRTVGTPARKISFSTVPPELIPNDYPDDDQEVQETIEEVLDDAGSETYIEIPEDIPENIAQTAHGILVGALDPGHYGASAKELETSQFGEIVGLSQAS